MQQHGAGRNYFMGSFNYYAHIGCCNVVDVW